MKNRFEASFQYSSMKLHNNTLNLRNIFVCSSVGVICFKHENKNVCVRPIFIIKMYVEARFSNKNACVQAGSAIQLGASSAWLS